MKRETRILKIVAGIIMFIVPALFISWVYTALSNAHLAAGEEPTEFIETFKNLCLYGGGLVLGVIAVRWAGAMLEWWEID